MAKKKKKKAPVALEDTNSIYLHAMNFASECLRAGESENFIAEKIKETYPVLTDANVQFAIHRGAKMISNQFARDSKSIISLHVKRYNKEIKNLLGKTYEGLIDEDIDEDVEGGKDSESAALKRKMRIYALMNCLDVMFAKEKVLQLHTKQTQVKVFNQLNAKVKEKKVMFNLKDLSLNEKIEFLALIQKAKKSDNELYSVTMSNKTQEVIEDIEHEEVENNNINEIRLIEPEAVKLKVKKDLSDITKKIHENLAKKALKQFVKKGGIQGSPTEKDYTEINEL